MAEFGKLIIFFGILLILVGVFISFGGKLGWLGKLPGDLYVEREGFKLYFPVVTCLVLSIILTLIVNLFRR